MTDRSLAALALALAGLSGCARVVAPAGGPEDKTPPVFLKATPDSGAVNVSRSAPIVLEFTEWINPATVKSTLTLMPAPSRAPEILVDGPVVTLRLREPLDSGTTAVLRLGAGIADFRGAAIPTTREIPFSTGPVLDSGTLVVRVWKGSDTSAPKAALAKVGLYATDSVRRHGLARLLRRRDSLSWLESPPSPWREKAWRWAQTDSNGVARFAHLPPGRWRVLAWDDADKDGYWRPGDEALGWSGDLDWTGRAARGATLARLSPLDTLVAAQPAGAKADSVKPRDAARRAKDSLRALAPDVVAGKRAADSLARRADSLARRDSLRLDSLAARDAALPDDSARILVLDSLPGDLAQDARLRLRLFRLDARRRPVLARPGPKGTLQVRVPRGGKWGGEIWIDRDGDDRVQSGDPVRLKVAEPWRPLDTLLDDPADESPTLRWTPVPLPDPAGATP